MDDIKYIPITERDHALLNRASNAPPAILNLCVRVDILEQIDEALFAEAVKLAVERLPYCRYRLHDMPDGTVCEYESTMEQQKPCELFDFSDYSEKKLDRTLRGWAGEPFPDKIRDTQLYRIRLMRLADGKHSVFLCGHHIIMDIFAVLYAGTYIVKVYDALVHGTELPQVGADPAPLIEKQNAFCLSEKMEKQKQWWRDAFATEPQFTSLNGIGHKEFVKGKRYGRDRGLLQMKAEEYEYRIPKQLSDRINEQALLKNESPYVYYVAALRTYLAKMNETDDVEFISLSMHRATLAEKSSGLIRVTGIPFRSVITGDLSFAELTGKLNVLNREYIRRLDIPDISLFVEQYHNVPQGMVYSSIMFSYAPFIDFSQLPMKITARKIDSGISLAPLYILLVPTDESGELSMFYQIAKGYIKPQSVERFHAFMLRFLEAGLDNPEKSVEKLWAECR